MLFCNLRQFSNLHSEFGDRALQRGSAVIFTALLSSGLLVDAGTYWLFLCGRTGGASEGFPALLFCQISFISGKAAALLSSPGPGRLTLPVSCWAVPFPRVAWPWQAAFQFPPSQEGYEGLTPTESSWKAMPWVMGRLGAPRPRRRLGTGSPKSTLGTAFHYRLLTSAGSATNYFGTRASHSEQAPRSEVSEQLLGEPGNGDCRETAVLARPCWGHLRLSLSCVCRGKL